jgi:hypothetical protein
MQGEFAIEELDRWKSASRSEPGRATENRSRQRTIPTACARNQILRFTRVSQSRCCAEPNSPDGGVGRAERKTTNQQGRACLPSDAKKRLVERAGAGCASLPVDMNALSSR